MTVNFNTQQIKSNIDLSGNIVQSAGKIPSNPGEELGTKHPSVGWTIKHFLSEPRGNGCLGSKPRGDVALLGGGGAGPFLYRKKRTKGKVNRSVPWKHDFKNNCVKCNRAYHLQEHHITYKPEIKVFLCETCHKKVTKLNTAAAPIAKTNLITKPVYTNKIRVMLWRWFVKAPKSVKYTTGNLPILVKSIIGKA